MGTSSWLTVVRVAGRPGCAAEAWAANVVVFGAHLLPIRPALTGAARTGTSSWLTVVSVAGRPGCAADACAANSVLFGAHLLPIRPASQELRGWARHPGSRWSVLPGGRAVRLTLALEIPYCSVLSCCLCARRLRSCAAGHVILAHGAPLT